MYKDIGPIYNFSLIFFKIIHIFIIMSILKYMLDIDTEAYFQYNILFLVNFFLKVQLTIYKQISLFNYSEEKIQFFILYPYIYIIVGLIILRFIEEEEDIKKMQKYFFVLYNGIRIRSK